MMLEEETMLKLKAIILEIGSEFDVRVYVRAGAAGAAAGALVGLALGGVRGAALGAGAGAALGAGAVGLAAAWGRLGELRALLCLVLYNRLRAADRRDWERAAAELMRCAADRRRVAQLLIAFLCDNLEGVTSALSPHDCGNTSSEATF